MERQDQNAHQELSNVPFLWAHCPVFRCVQDPIQLDQKGSQSRKVLFPSNHFVSTGHVLSVLEVSQPHGGHHLAKECTGDLACILPRLDKIPSSVGIVPVSWFDGKWMRTSVSFSNASSGGRVPARPLLRRSKLVRRPSAVQGENAALSPVYQVHSSASVNQLSERIQLVLPDVLKYKVARTKRCIFWYPVYWCRYVASDNHRSAWNCGEDTLAKEAPWS
mmetsp:Transcript_28299/g.65574  ORF Transcript_28299/g.65574 Transcript_28299/m.65574 type:complete len:220 (-) Transcript_28299:1133-1792(-)